MGFEQHGVFEFHNASAFLDGFFHEDKDLGHGEKSDHRAGDIDTVVKLINTKHVARGPFHRVHADGGEDEPEGAAHETLDHGAGGDAGDDGESEEGEPEIFRTAEFHRKLCKERCEEVEGNAGKKPPEEGSGAGGAERFARASLFGELIAVECGRSRSRSARGVDQDGADGAAEDGAAVNAAEHDEARFCLHPEGERQEKRDAHRRREPWHTADNDADGDADHHHEKIHRVQSITEALGHQC